MKTFTIENETNNIIIHASSNEAEAVPNAERFANEAALAELAANWPSARLIDIWNSLPGETPVKKFSDRASAITRIWKAIQHLDQAAPTVADEADPSDGAAPVSNSLPDTAHGSSPASGQTLQSDDTAPPEGSSESRDSAPVDAMPLTAPVIGREKPDVKTRRTRTKKAIPADVRNFTEPREGSKTSLVIAMLRREGGITLEEIMAAMGWQKHTTRAMLSAGGSLTKKHGLTIKSDKAGDQRRYSIQA